MPLPTASPQLSEGACDFIDESVWMNLLDRPADASAVRDVIAKSLAKEPLTETETAVLLNATSPDLVEEIFAAARQLKRDVYGNRIVLFAPLYIGNHCVNDCEYCGFRSGNPAAIRRTLDVAEIQAQVTALEQKGHKRLILVFGEHPWYTPEFIADAVRTVYAVKEGQGEIRRVNINAAPLDHEGFPHGERSRDRNVPGVPRDVSSRHVCGGPSAGHEEIGLLVAAGCVGPGVRKRL
jgi:2-iminoacetate synthase